MKTGKSLGVKILDCTTRDGGYCNQWRFEKKLVRQIYRSLAKAGVDYYEIGYRGHAADFDPAEYGLWHFSSEDDIREVTEGIEGPAIAVMSDYGKARLDQFPLRSESAVSLVRIASHRHTLKEALILLGKIRAKGYQTSLQAMGYSGYSAEERREFARMIASAGIDFAYIADTYGSIFPHEIEGLFEPLLKMKKTVQIGFHPHNSLQMAFANSIEAIRCGVDILDSSIFGMGRGAGNLPTEIILAYLHDKMPDKFNVIPVLNCIDEYFIEMQKRFGWGYQLPYMLSGLFQCHPSYAQKLVDFKEFTMDDIWRALESIQKKNPSGFSEPLLHGVISQGIAGKVPAGDDSAKAVERLPTSGKSRRAVAVPYLDRHRGRTFLVLGNGPTLKTYQDQINKLIVSYKPVVLGANYLGGLFVPDYHAFSNKRRFVNYIDTVSPHSSLLIGRFIPAEMIREYTQRDYETIEYLDSLEQDFDIVNGVIQCNCRTVSVLLMGLAVAMGAEKILAAGMDGYLNLDDQGNPLFYRETDEKRERDLIVEMHQSNAAYIRQINDYLLKRGKEGVHILTPTSYGEFYKGIKNYI